jgi:4-aminobutyrate aminotransferase
MARRHPLIAEVRGLGLLLGIVLRRPDGAPAIEEAERVMYGCLRRGLNFKVTMGYILTLTPALTVSESELDLALKILDDALSEVEEASAADAALA